MRNIGLIMSLEGKQAVVLTSSGEFRKVNIKKNSKPRVGEEIYLGSDSYFSNMSTSKWGLIAASILVILVLPMYWQFNGFNGQQQEVAYVNIDINPSIELALNADNEVIKVRGLNNDGTQLLDDLNLKNTNVEQAVAAITNEAEEKGYINPSKENLVVISLAAKDKNIDASKYVALSSTLEKKVEKNFIANKLNGHVETIKASAVMREEAQDLDLSVGKYAVLLSAWDSGLKITADEIRSKSIAKAIKAVGGDLGVVVGKAHENQNLDELAVKYSPEITQEKINQKVTKGNKKERVKEKNKDKAKAKDKEKDESLKIDEENEVHNPKAEKDKENKDKVKKKNEKQEKAVRENNKDQKDNKNSSKEEVKETITPVMGDDISDGKKNNSSTKNTNKENQEVKNNKEKKTKTNQNKKEKENNETNIGGNREGNNSKNKKVKTPEEPTRPKVPKVETPKRPDAN